MVDKVVLSDQTTEDRPKILTIQFEGNPEPAVEVGFEPEREGWSNYVLDDGTIIKMKNVATRVFRLLNKNREDGSPVFVLEGTAVVTTIKPDGTVSSGAIKGS